MAITTYTTYDDIRAVLGVSAEELPDTVISLQVYENALMIAMTGKSGVIAPDTEDRNLEEHYAYLTALVSPTSDDLRNIAIIEEYATYVVASALCGAISMYAPKTQADGKAVLTRFSSEDTFERVCRGVNTRLGSLVGIINELLGLTVSTGIGGLYVATPDFNQVTGE